MAAWHRLSTLLLAVGLGGCLSEYIVGAAISEDCPGIDLNTDPDNCSACGVPCDEGQACIDGDCSDDCPSGEQVCQRACVNIQTDALHCGDCDTPCPAGEACVAGSCVDECDGMCDPILQLCSDGRCVCRIGLSLCNGACVDRLTDNGNCGMCTTMCMQGICEAGICVPTCDAPQTECPDGVCSNLAEDPLHCGDCGRECTADQVCVGGSCQDFAPASCSSCPCPPCGDRACCPNGNGAICVEGTGCPA